MLPRLRRPLRRSALVSPQRRPVIAAAAVGLTLVAPGAVEAIWQTNMVQLDPGACGRLLASGPDKTASSSARPAFLLYGDGGLSSYAMAIDGRPIGTFAANARDEVCIDAG